MKISEWRGVLRQQTASDCAEIFRTEDFISGSNMFVKMRQRRLCLSLIRHRTRKLTQVSCAHRFSAYFVLWGGLKGWYRSCWPLTSQPVNALPFFDTKKAFVTLLQGCELCKQFVFLYFCARFQHISENCIRIGVVWTRSACICVDICAFVRYLQLVVQINLLCRSLLL